MCRIKTEGLLPLGADAAALQTLHQRFVGVKVEIVVTIVVVAFAVKVGAGKDIVINR